MNKVILCGNLTRDVELASTSNGVTFGKFALAVQRSFANQDSEREVDFINIIVWRNTAENCGKFLKKGSKALVEGELHIRSYEDETGSKRYVTEVVADKVEFVGPKATSNGESNSIPDDLEPLDPDDPDNSLPF